LIFAKVATGGNGPTATQTPETSLRSITLNCSYQRVRPPALPLELVLVTS
jgi:hypothetical protein